MEFLNDKLNSIFPVGLCFTENIICGNKSGPSQAWGVCVPVQVRESGALLGQSVRDPKVRVPVATPKERPASFSSQSGDVAF